MDVAANVYMGIYLLYLLHSCGLMAFLLVAASDTTAAALGVFILAMASFPEIQKKAQEELDRVLCGRLPTHADIKSLPYLSAIIKEVLRYVPESLGIHHCFFFSIILSGCVVFSDGDLLFPWVSTCYSYSAMSAYLLVLLLV